MPHSVQSYSHVKKKKHIYGGCSIATFDYRRVLINSNHSYSSLSFALGSSGASWGGICRGALARLHIMESDWFKKSCGISDPSGKVRLGCGWSSHLDLTINATRKSILALGNPHFPMELCCVIEGHDPLPRSLVECLCNHPRSWPNFSGYPLVI